jgi:hypothetical protein
MIDVWKDQYRVFRDFVPFDDEEDENGDEEFEPILFNPPRRTYYLGRGRHGNNSKLHRALLRKRPNPFDED